MWSRLLAFAGLCGACGAVNNATTDAPADGSPPARTYKGNVAESSPAMFGVDAPGKCLYSMTLRQLSIELGILPSGQPVSGQVQVLNVEAVLNVGTCPYLPADPSITNFTFASAMADPGGMLLMFQEHTGDKPGASLVAELSGNSAAYQAQLTFHRTDLGPPLDWTVLTAATLTLP